MGDATAALMDTAKKDNPGSDRGEETGMRSRVDAGGYLTWYDYSNRRLHSL